MCSRMSEARSPDILVEMSPLLKVTRHGLGPRLHVFGRRIHEWHVGAVVLAADGVAAGLGLLSLLPSLVVACVGLWLMAKDWADLTRGGRDTKAWHLGLHRRPLLELRSSRCSTSSRP